MPSALGVKRRSIRLYLGLLSISFGIEPKLRQQEESDSVYSVWRITTVRVPPCEHPRHTNQPNHHHHRGIQSEDVLGRVTEFPLDPTCHHLTPEETARNCPSPSTQPRLGLSETRQHWWIIAYSISHSSFHLLTHHRHLIITNTKWKLLRVKFLCDESSLAVCIAVYYSVIFDATTRVKSTNKNRIKHNGFKTALINIYNST